MKGSTNLRLALASALLAVSVSACAIVWPTRELKISGFLDDYSILQEGKKGQARLIYRNPNADWKTYDKILFEPVAIWRGGKSSLDEIPEEDLQRLANDLHHAIRAKLELYYELVDEPAPGVMRIRLALTDARKSDPTLDIFTTVVAPMRMLSELRRLTTGTQAFVGAATIEGEITDAQTDDLLVAAVDSWIGRRSLKGSADSWADVEEAFEFWAERISTRLGEARRGEWR